MSSLGESMQAIEITAVMQTNGMHVVIRLQPALHSKILTSIAWYTTMHNPSTHIRVPAQQLLYLMALVVCRCSMQNRDHIATTEVHDSDVYHGSRSPCVLFLLQPQ